MSTVADEYLVILVHGTCATGAPWTQPGSFLRKELKRQLEARGATKVRFARLIWNGANSDAGRLEASERLRLRLYFLLGGQPEGRCFLIGHSHGGNVALHALVHSKPIREHVRGVITLATPFLLFEDEPATVALLAAALDKARTFALIGTAAALAMSALLYGLIQLVPWLFRLKLWMLHQGWLNQNRLCGLISDSNCPQIVSVSIGTIGALTSVTLLVGILSHLYESATEAQRHSREEAQSLLEALCYAQPKETLLGTPILVLSGRTDEALQILTGAWWMHRTALWVVRASVIVSLLGGLLATVAGLWWIWLQQEQLLAQSAPSLPAMLGLSIAWLLAAPVFFLAGTLVGWFLRAFVRLPIPGHGTQTGLHNLFWTARARHEPFQSANLTTRSYPVLRLLQEGRGLIHSRLYASKSAIADMADWMTEQAGHAAAPHNAHAEGRPV